MYLNYEDPCITVTNQQLMPRATSCEYLGIEVGEALGWQCQANVICGKVSAGIGVLKRIRLALGPRQTLLQMHETIVPPYLNYSPEIWGTVAFVKSSVIMTDYIDCKIGPG